MKARHGVLVALVTAMVVASPAAAQVPAPPPNPTDQELRAGRDAVRARAAELGRLSLRAADLDRQAGVIQNELDTRREEAFQRLLELQQAREAADAAEREAGIAAAATQAAAQAVTETRRRLDEFATNTYLNNLDLGPLALLTAATSAADLVDRAAMTDLVAQEQLRAQERFERARTESANAESAARAAAERAAEQRSAADAAKVTADQGVAQAESAVAEQQRRLAALIAERSVVEKQLEANRRRDDALRGQRKVFLDYQRRAAEQEQARRAAAQAAADADPSARSSGATDVNSAAGRLGPEYACRQATPRWGPIKPWVAEAGNLLRCRFGIRAVGGVGARPNPSDHPAGLALDFSTGATGDALAECAVRNRDRLAINYVIYRQRINQGSGWRPMENRGSPVANHMEHVHISFRPGQGGGRGPLPC